MLPVRTVALLAAACVAASRIAHAGGPLIFAEDGSVVKWPTVGGQTSITLTLDQGSLGALDNGAANAMVVNILSVWNSIATSTLALTIAPTPLTSDVTHLNFTSFIGGSALHGFNPVVYDSAGSITALLYGENARNQVLGFATPIFYVNADRRPVPGNILEGQVVLNGRMLDGVSSGSANPEVTPAEFEGVIVHELGHMLGLDHSQINALDASNADQPTMFPIFYGGEHWKSLAPDDIGWICWLYPAPQFNTAFGAIAGGVLVVNGMTTRGYQGINVIARRVGGARIEAGSCVSGYRYWSGVGPPGLEGGYLIPGLPAGSYTVEVERILPIFTGGSSVGPLDVPADFPGSAGPEFYNGMNESSSDNPADKTHVLVAADRVTSGISIILNTGEAGAVSWTHYR